MTVDDVIPRLVRDLKPVTPLSLPATRAWRWGVLAAVSGALVVGATGVRPDLARVGTSLTFQAHAVLVLLATSMAALAALALSVPGERLHPRRLWTPLLAAAVWVALLSADIGLAMAGGDMKALSVDFGWGCVAKALTLEVLPGVVLFTMIGRAAALDVRRTLLFAGLATAGIGALGVQFTCPKTATMHLIVWHAGPVLALTATAALAGAPLFAWISRGNRGGEPR
jgi:hypothetical protein